MIEIHTVKFNTQSIRLAKGFNDSNIYEILREMYRANEKPQQPFSIQIEWSSTLLKNIIQLKRLFCPTIQ